MFTAKSSTNLKELSLSQSLAKCSSPFSLHTHLGDLAVGGMAHREGKDSADAGLQKVNLSHGKILKFHMNSFCL